MGAAQGNDRFNFDTFLLHGYQQERDALLFFAGIAGASQTKDPVCDVGESRPYLRAVDGVVATVVRHPAFGLEVCKVRPCVGLGIALAPVDFSGSGYPAETVVAVLRCRSSLTPVPAWKAQREIPRSLRHRGFLLPDIVLSWGPAGTAKAVGHLGTSHPPLSLGEFEPVQTPLPVIGFGVVRIGRKKISHVFLERQVLWAQIYVHDGSLKMVF